ncbi:MAG: hypothetical protein ABL957_13800 [Parvularculaceae bacterium]
MLLDMTLLQHVLVVEQVTPSVATAERRHRVYYYAMDGTLAGFAPRTASVRKVVGDWGVHANRFLCTKATTHHTYGPPRVSLNCYPLEELKTQIIDSRRGDFLNTKKYDNPKGRAKFRQGFYLRADPLYSNLDEVKADIEAFYK